MKLELLKEEVNKGFDELDNGIVSTKSFSDIAREVVESLIQSELIPANSEFPPIIED